MYSFGSLFPCYYIMVFIKAKAQRIILVMEEYNWVKYCSKTERNYNKTIIISILSQLEKHTRSETERVCIQGRFMEMDITPP